MQFNVKEKLSAELMRRFDAGFRAEPINGHDILVIAGRANDDIHSCLKEDIISEPIEKRRFLEWCGDVTITDTLTYEVLTRCFSNIPINVWIGLDRINKVFKGSTVLEKRIKIALDRLVILTKHELYNMEFAVEADGERYRIVKLIKQKEEVLVVDEKEESDDLAVEEEGDLNRDCDCERGEPLKEKTKRKKSKKIHVPDAIGDCDYRTRWLNHNVPEEDENREWIKEFQQGDENKKRRALEYLIKNNARLVIWVAKTLVIGKRDRIFWDAFQAGCLGIKRTAEKFDLNAGYKFSTYATYWSRSFMQRIMAKENHQANVPYYLVEDAYKLKNILKRADGEKRKLSLRELSEKMGKEESYIMELFNFLTSRDISISHSREGEDGELMENQTLEVVLRKLGMANDDGEEEYVEFAELSREMTKWVDVIEEAMTMYGKKKTNRDFYMLFRKLDIYTMPWAGTTLEDIGEECGISREGVRLIITKVRNGIIRAMKRKDYGEDRISAFDALLKDDMRYDPEGRCNEEMESSQIRAA